MDRKAGLPRNPLLILAPNFPVATLLTSTTQRLDKAVEATYGKTFTNDADRVAHLFYLYQTLTEGLIAKKVRLKNI
jgi:hypothetical protein